MNNITVIPSDPTAPDARALIAALDHYLGQLYQPEDNHLLDPEQLKAPDIRFLLARRDGRAVGCGALRIDPSGYGEIKRMYVDPIHRGRGIASSIMAGLEQQARAEGLGLLKLETGTLQREAVGLYRRLGFTDCGAFGDYPCGGDASIFMEKKL
ncbi:GNAT family N-acetyltransferase [Niveispirillum sp.]|uniref:GNAT family N-acetyltransferase n=1 Tax=Niveispirillum sp. TaxID=1917217 RepID=UPI001B632453|nr:GNAT family N-acetyltransferase [Niveispirillum sp.]MBP7334399.1 GNAT family N-acetyltransferase [Niveispirillum sp.]